MFKLVKVPNGFTLYTIQKLCLQCWRNNIESSKKCAFCGHLFLKEATAEEQEEMINKLNSQREERKNEVENESENID